MAKILVVANQTLTGDDLLAFVKARMETGPCEFTLLVPATARVDLAAPTAAMPPYAAAPEPDVDADYAEARKRLGLGLAAIRRLGATVEGDVGDADPLTAIRDTLAHGAFDEVILSTLPSGASRWLRQDLPHKVERKFRLPVSVVTAGEVAAR
jgi:hypothetical protein